jgi:hypothetical protein
MAVATIPNIRLTLKDGTICDLQQDMGRLMWDAHHPRIQGYLNRCAKRYGVDSFTLGTAPSKVLNRLAIFVNLFWQCYQTLSLMGLNWDDAQVRIIFSAYGNAAHIPMDGWIKLLAHLHNRWLESDIAF